MTEKTIKNPTDLPDESRRDFLTDATNVAAAGGAACACYPFIRSLAPNDKVKAKKYTEIDISGLAPGDSKIEVWQGKPVYIQHRTDEQIALAAAQDSEATMDPQNDSDRIQKKKWLITLLVCSHLGCTPNKGGDYDGWSCPCHGSQFDSSGRVRRGPAGLNLEIPPYKFLDATTIKIG